MFTLRLSAAAHFPATSFVAVLGVICASVFMDMTGGGLKPYEMQTAQAALQYVVGDASAEEAFAGPPPLYPSWRSPAPPPAPMVYTAASDASAGLMGGLGAQVGRFQPSEVRAVQRDSQTCPSGVQWVSAPASSAEATT